MGGVLEGFKKSDEQAEANQEALDLSKIQRELAYWKSQYGIINEKYEVGKDLNTMYKKEADLANQKLASLEKQVSQKDRVIDSLKKVITELTLALTQE